MVDDPYSLHDAFLELLYRFAIVLLLLLALVSSVIFEKAMSTAQSLASQADEVGQPGVLALRN